MKIMGKLTCGLGVAAMLSMCAAVQADQRVAVGYEMPIKVVVNVNATDCDNSPGPFVTLQGAIELGGIQAQLIFQNNVKGTHQHIETIGTPAVLVPAGGSITIPKQPVRGGVGGNPWIYIQFFNCEGNLTPEILLGRCVQGLTVEQDLFTPALLSTLVTGADCSNNPGPKITFEGDVSLSGLKARIIFKNNAKGTHTKAVTAEVELFADGTKVVIPKQPVLGGVGGNPWIWLQFLQDTGAPIGDRIFLGRCSQM